MKFGPWWESFGLSGFGASILTIRAAVAWPSVGWPEAIGLFLCLCVHYGKSYLVVHQNSDSDSVKADIAQLNADLQNLEAKMSGLALSVGLTTSVNGEG